MKKVLIACLAFIVVGVTEIHAQDVIDKANGKLNKVDRASDAADRANNTINKIGGLFKKKKKVKDDDASSSDNSDYNTVINIKGISMANLKTLNSNVKACKGVSETKIKFSGSGASKIYIAHKGSTDNLMEELQKKSKDIFTDKNIDNMDDESVDISLGGGDE